MTIVKDRRLSHYLGVLRCIVNDRRKFCRFPSFSYRSQRFTGRYIRPGIVSHSLAKRGIGLQKHVQKQSTYYLDKEIVRKKMIKIYNINLI
jgi:hypothetical protein